MLAYFDPDLALKQNGPHTPGPWTTDVVGGHYLVYRQSAPIARLTTDEKVLYANCWNNARLIAAAPDMYEALCLAHDYLAGNGWEGDPRMKPILDAIAKASPSKRTRSVSGNH